MNQIATTQSPSLVNSMAARYDMEPGAFVGAIEASVIKGNCSNEQFAAFLMVAKEYDLNPLTKEIYAFPDRGGITPIVSIDGWMKLINSHPQFDGMDFEDIFDGEGKLSSVICRIYRKDRSRPVSITEYMSECARSTDPWKKWPNRMLRHKTAIQAARYAFGFSGIMEPDEFERMKDVTPTLQERMAAKRAEQTQEQSKDGFDLERIEAVTVSEKDVVEAEILQEKTSGFPGDEGQQESAPEAMPADPLVEYQTALGNCSTAEEVDALTPQFADTINGLSVEDKRRAKQMRIDAKGAS